MISRTAGQTGETEENEVTFEGCRTPWPNTEFIVGPAAAAAKSLQSCLTLCDLIDGSPPGSAVLGILQARTLEWVAISFSNAWKWKVKVKSLSRVRPSATPWTAAFQPPLRPWDFQARVLEWVPLPSPIIGPMDMLIAWFCCCCCC